LYITSACGTLVEPTDGDPVALVAANRICSLLLLVVINPVTVSLASLRTKLALSIPSSVAALTLVNPLPLPVNVLVPMLMFPKLLVILPEFSAPVPVMLAWCCVTLDTVILALGIFPLVKLLAFNAVKFVPIPLNPVVPVNDN